MIKDEGREQGEAIVHILALAIDKFLNHNCNANRWENTRGVVKGKMDRHDYSFKPAFAEMAACKAGMGIDWALHNTIVAYEDIARLPRAEFTRPVEICIGSAASLAQIDAASITPVVVDPPYADNVQYSELADFFYVWLKRTQGHHHPEWFSSYLCDHDQKAVVNMSRHRDKKKSANEARREVRREARKEAHNSYQRLMTETFTECKRILRNDGVLTVMFTHKKQEAWEALFTSLIQAGFTITATWPVKTESEHSLHQAK